MSFFLLKPHITGPEGNITSPDIMVDQLFVDAAQASVDHVTHGIWRQVGSGDAARAAFAIMALGGGAIILPALVLASGPVVVARKAWRLANIEPHIQQVELNGTQLDNLQLPATMIANAGGTGDALGRGLMLVQTHGEDTRNAVLHDPVLGRRLDHRVVFEPAEEDRWGKDRPVPRYSVGPTQKEVPHFI